MKKKLISLIQILVGLGLIAFIFTNMKNKGDLLEAMRTASRHGVLLTLGIGGFFVCLSTCALRWHLLLKAQGFDLRFRRALALYFVGHFFNAFLFGVTGGDVVKAYFAAVELPEKKTEAVATVFIDRIIGLIALVALTVAIMLARLRFFFAYTQMRYALAFNVALLLVTVGFCFAVLRRNLLEQSAFFRTLAERTAVGGMVGRAYKAFRFCMNRPGLVLKTAALSVVNHVALIVSTFCLGSALEIRMRFLDYFTVFPVINAIAAIPVTPGGLGTREGVSIFLLGVFGVPETRAVLLSLLLYASLLAWSLVGGIVYIGYTLTMGREAVRRIAESGEPS
jgi:glycosyltransferase 2 family protein